MYKASDVANYIINLANAQIDKDFWISEWITHLKLQKILYFAQATFLSCIDKKLFNDKIYAWKHGPIVKSIYDKYKRTESKALNSDTDFDETNINDEDKKTIDNMRSFFWKYSASQLVDMSHSHDPRKKTEQSKEISTDIIKNFYKGKIILN